MNETAMVQPAPGKQGTWLAKAGSVFLLTVVTAWAYQSLGPWLQERYSAADSFYGHGWLVPLVSLFLLWRESDPEAETSRQQVPPPCGIVWPTCPL